MAQKSVDLPGLAAAPAARLNLRRSARAVVLYALSIALGVLFMAPFAWTLASAFKSPFEMFAFPPLLLPEQPRPENFVEIFRDYPFLTWFRNTLLVVLLATAGTVVTASLVAYGFARFDFRFKGALFGITIATMLLPSQVSLIPRFILFHHLGWLDTLLPLWVPYWFGGSAFAIFLLRQFILSLPRELDEAAIIDGASELRVYWNILMPLCKPALATLAIISFIAHWDSFLDPVIFLHSPENFTIAIGLWFFKAQPMQVERPTAHLLMAASVTSIAVPIALFFAFQRYFVQGIALTGLKG
jgi:multiple sugar transport system permease protein